MVDASTFREEAIAATRQLAKRQLTWLRARLDARWFDPATERDGLEQALHALDNEVAEEIMALAIEMARRMVKLTLAEHPETVLETVRTALLQLPQGHAQIHLHPDDMARVQALVGAVRARPGAAAAPTPVSVDTSARKPTGSVATVFLNASMLL